MSDATKQAEEYKATSTMLSIDDPTDLNFQDLRGMDNDSNNLIINGIPIPLPIPPRTSPDSRAYTYTAIAIATAINTQTALHKVTASTMEAIIDFTGGTYTTDALIASDLVINGTQIIGHPEAATPAALATLINDRGVPGVVASVNGTGQLRLVATDDRNIEVLTGGTAVGMNFTNFATAGGAALVSIKRGKIRLVGSDNAKIIISGTKPEYFGFMASTYSEASQCNTLQLINQGQTTLKYLSAAQFMAFCQVLEQCHVDKLYLHKHLYELCLERFQALCHILSNCHWLQSLSLDIRYLDLDRVQLLSHALLQCRGLKNIDIVNLSTLITLTHISDIRKQLRLLQTIEDTRLRQFIQDKKSAKTFLLCWHRLRKEETASATTLGHLNKDLIMKILDDTGSIHNAQVNAAEFVKPCFTLKYSYS